MTRTVDRRIEEAIGIEGGYVNHEADRGGPTRWGITEQEARAYGYHGSMRELPRETAVEIYRKRYWERPGLAEVAKRYEHVATEMFDTGINMGIQVAARFLQRALNALNRGATDYPDIKVDGDIGPMTLFALDGYKRRRGAAGELILLRSLECQQGERYLDITEGRPANEAFTYGWFANRIGIRS